MAPGGVGLGPPAVPRFHAPPLPGVFGVEVVRFRLVVVEAKPDPLFVIVADPPHEVSDHHGTGVSGSELVDVVDERLGEGFHFSSAPLFVARLR